MKGLKGNIVYNFIYNIVVLCFPLIITPYISRVLGADGIGTYAMHYSIAQFFVIFAMLGLNNYGVRAISETNLGSKETLSRTFWEIYQVQFVCTTIILIAYLLYCGLISKDKTISILFGLYVVSCFFDISWFYSGIEQFKTILTRNVLVKIANLILIILLVKDRNDIVEYVFIMVFGMLVSQMSLWFFVPKYIEKQKVSIIRSFKKHFLGNIKFLIPVLAVSIYKYMDKIMLGAMASNSDLGYYENVEKIVNIPVAFVTALGTVMLARVTNLYARGNTNSSETYMENSIIFTMFLSSGMVFGILGIAKEFVPLFFGSGFEKCISLIYIMVPTVFFLGISNVIRTQYLIPAKREKIYIESVCIGAFVNLVLNYILIPRFKSFGAAIGTFLAEMFVLLYQYIRVKRDIKIQKVLIYSLGYLVLGVLMWFLLINLNFLYENNLVHMCVKIIIGAIFYCVLSIGYLWFSKRLKT